MFSVMSRLQYIQYEGVQAYSWNEEGRLSKLVLHGCSIFGFVYCPTDWISGNFDSKV